MNPIFDVKSIHYVKIIVCYIIEKCGGRVSEDMLIDVIRDCDIVDYFSFTEALRGLIGNETVTEESVDGKKQLLLTQKGLHGAEYYELSIPIYYRRACLNSIIRFRASEELSSVVESSVTETDDGAVLSLSINDGSHKLISVSLYAPDTEQARYMEDKIKTNPAMFYKKTLEYILENTEESAEITK